MRVARVGEDVAAMRWGAARAVSDHQAAWDKLYWPPDQSRKLKVAS